MDKTFFLGKYFACIMINEPQTGRYFFLKIGTHKSYDFRNIIKICIYKRDGFKLPGLDFKLGK